jgi:hypothetical protein
MAALQQNMLRMRQMPSVQGIVQQMLNTQRAADQQFYLVIVPEDADPTMRECNTIEQLTNTIREFLGTRTSLFPFLGYPLRISRGPNRFMATPFGTLPLFDLPQEDQLEFETAGYVGPDDTDFTPPQTPAPPHQIPEDDEDGYTPSQSRQPSIGWAEQEDEDDDESPTLPTDT